MNVDDGPQDNNSPVPFELGGHAWRRRIPHPACLLLPEAFWSNKTINVTIRRAVKNTLYGLSPALGTRCAELWDALQPVVRGRMTLRSATRYIIRGLCPGLGGKFTYYGTKV